MSLDYPIVWPAVIDELRPFLKHCKGLVLNAGSGKRELKLGERELNIDIVPENQPDIVGDLHSIPLLDETVDTIVSVAVLEHTKFPWIVAQEFQRVLKPGGYGVIGVPFLQPQHACPDDYCRFTENGLVELMKYSGFEVVETDHVHHFGQTIAWLLWEYLQENMPKNKLVLRLWFWLIRQLSLGNFLGEDSSNTHNTHYIVVRKPGKATVAQSKQTKSLIKDSSRQWFFSILACPNTKQPLHLRGDKLVTESSTFDYEIVAKIPRLLPAKNIRYSSLHQVAELVERSVKTEESVQQKAEINKAVVKETLEISPENVASSMRFLSTQEFEVSFKSPFAEQLQNANPKRVAVLATNEYEGIFRNGGIGTHYKTLSEQLAQNNWYVILLLATQNESYGGNSNLAAIDSIFSIREVHEVLALQTAHKLMLEQFSADWIEYQSFCNLLFVQALSELFQNTPIYIEFHEMYGAGYHTIQAKQSNLLKSNCVVSLTMHSGCEWIYEANEWFSDEYPGYYKQLCDYEQFSFENADLTFYPSHFLAEKVKAYGWHTARAKHMPYFIPVVRQNHFIASNLRTVTNQPHSQLEQEVPIVFFGRLEMRKGIITFINALKLLAPDIQKAIHVYFVGKSVQLHISKFGDLQSDQYIRREIGESISYSIHSDFYSDQAIRFICGLNHPIVCLASHQENFPNTGLEMGQLPVSLVISDTGGFRETLKLVNRSAGVYWFEPENPFSLSDMLSKAFFNQPEVPEVPSLASLEDTNQQLLAQKLGFIEEALNRKSSTLTDLPKVTIGITCYKLGKYLIDCLLSVEMQTYGNLEVIVLDDASPDIETQQYIEQAKELFPNYKFIRAEFNLGLGGARNRLIEMTEGKYFLPLDADNRLPPFAIEQFVNAALHSQAEIVISAMLGFEAASFIGSFKHSSIPALLQMNISGDACSLFSTELLRKFKHPERRDCSTHDWCIISAATATGIKVLHYPYPLYEYRVRKDSMIQHASFAKERYYVRQYLAQIPPSEWSSRQIYMMMTAIQELNAQQQKLQVEVQTARAETQQVRSQLEAELKGVKQKLKHVRGRVQQMRENLENIQVELTHSNDRIHAMETSKFWQIRKGWFKVKKLLNLPSNE